MLVRFLDWVVDFLTKDRKSIEPQIVGCIVGVVYIVIVAHKATEGTLSPVTAVALFLSVPLLPILAGWVAKKLSNGKRG